MLSDALFLSLMLPFSDALLRQSLAIAMSWAPASASCVRGEMWGAAKGSVKGSCEAEAKEMYAWWEWRTTGKRSCVASRSEGWEKS